MMEEDFYQQPSGLPWNFGPRPSAPLADPAVTDAAINMLFALRGCLPSERTP
jgi:hypothetical protein